LSHARGAENDLRVPAQPGAGRGQGVFAPVAMAAPGKADCACPGCQKVCCATNPTPVSQPAAPVRAASVKDSLFVPVLLARLLDPPRLPILTFPKVLFQRPPGGCGSHFSAELQLLDLISPATPLVCPALVGPRTVAGI